MPARPQPAVLLALTIAVLPATFLRSSRRRFRGQARELLEYRSAVAAHTSRIDAVLGERPNQLERLREDVSVGAADLLDVAATPGEITPAGVRTNVSVGISHPSGC